MDIKFTKMQAYGNDYVYIDAVNQKIENPNELAKKLAERHYGIGSDGLVLICPSEKCEFRMRMFNPDGSEGEMCGNALRSMSKYIYDYKLTQKEEFFIETLGGNQHIWLETRDGKAVNITADIGKPVFDASKVPVNADSETFINKPMHIIDRDFFATAISWGNPHCVIFVDNVSEFMVEKYGRAIENNTSVFPKKTNVTFAEIVSSSYIKIREWERGTGETIGCGTGCCSAVVAANILGKCSRKVSVEQIGGNLDVEWKENDHIFMTGPSFVTFDGTFYIN